MYKNFLACFFVLFSTCYARVTTFLSKTYKTCITTKNIHVRDQKFQFNPHKVYPTAQEDQLSQWINQAIKKHLEKNKHQLPSSVFEVQTTKEIERSFIYKGEYYETM
jgi:hypothetical protein